MLRLPTGKDTVVVSLEVTIPFAVIVNFGITKDDPPSNDTLAALPYVPALAPLSLRVVAIFISLLPSKAAVPVASPDKLIFLAAEILFAFSDTP